MKTLMLTLAATPALTAGAASAQPFGSDRGCERDRGYERDDDRARAWMPIDQRQEPASSACRSRSRPARPTCWTARPAKP